MNPEITYHTFERGYSETFHNVFNKQEGTDFTGRGQRFYNLNGCLVMVISPDSPKRGDDLPKDSTGIIISSKSEDPERVNEARKNIETLTQIKLMTGEN